MTLDKLDIQELCHLMNMSIRNYYFSIEIFFEFLRNKTHTWNLTSDTPIPIIHIDDAIRPILQLLDTDNLK